MNRSVSCTSVTASLCDWMCLMLRLDGVAPPRELLLICPKPEARFPRIMREMLRDQCFGVMQRIHTSPIERELKVMCESSAWPRERYLGAFFVCFVDTTPQASDQSTPFFCGHPHHVHFIRKFTYLPSTLTKCKPLPPPPPVPADMTASRDSPISFVFLGPQGLLGMPADRVEASPPEDRG